jgi:hypothetical protein
LIERRDEFEGKELKRSGSRAVDQFPPDFDLLMNVRLVVSAGYRLQLTPVVPDFGARKAVLTGAYLKAMARTSVLSAHTHPYDESANTS